MRRLKTVRRPPIYPKTPGHLRCSSLTHPLPLSSRRPSVSFGGFGLSLRRSIPACAGEPRLSASPSSANKVYPRVCGGTFPLQCSPVRTLGLSPRVRGNQRQLVPGREGLGSIPACAGEPRTLLPDIGDEAVYPRVCGGTVGIDTYPMYYKGLSPRVRGNPDEGRAIIGYSRSIPACAGEPARGWLPSPSPRVYPRVCGGTGDRTVLDGLRGGLSPRVRGNRRTRVYPLTPGRSIPACAGEPQVQISGDDGGSIPACAGEPYIVRFVQDVKEVYPRVCGGTCDQPMYIAQSLGLSPRVRGNRKGERA